MATDAWVWRQVKKHNAQHAIGSLRGYDELECGHFVRNNGKEPKRRRCAKCGLERRVRRAAMIAEEEA